MSKNTPENANVGHGHVFPRPDGNRMRCGGPGMCAECSKDQARKDARATAHGEYVKALEAERDAWRNHSSGLCGPLHITKAIARTDAARLALGQEPQ